MTYDLEHSVGKKEMLPSMREKKKYKMDRIS